MCKKVFFYSSYFVIHGQSVQREQAAYGCKTVVVGDFGQFCLACIFKGPDFFYFLRSMNASMLLSLLLLSIPMLLLL